MKIAVVGAGIYGVTVATKLARAGFSVDLFEKENDILQAASGINQYRLHRGYHYPRSRATALSSKNTQSSFQQEYLSAVTEHHRHYYCIARGGSLVSGQEFLRFCRRCGLGYRETQLPILAKNTVEVVVKVRESLFDPLKLHKIVSARIDKSGVNLILDVTVTNKDLSPYTLIVNCAYAQINQLLADYPEARREYQFELCEKPVLKLPDDFRGLSVVILDGPFTCIDPYSDTPYHVMGNVVHAIHATNRGIFPVVPDEFRPLLNRGLLTNPPITNIGKFIDSASFFMPAIKKAEHIGSMYTIRTVLPNVEKTDERPTFVYPVDKRIVNVFSGKIGNCVDASDKVLSLVLARYPRRSFLFSAKPAQPVRRLRSVSRH